MNEFELAIKSHLDKVASEDPAFAEKYNERCAKEKDAIKSCCKYIENEIKNRIKEKRGCVVVKVTRDEAYGLAIHYFDENIEPPKEEDDAIVNASVPKVPVREVPKPSSKPKASKVDECQLSLF